MIAKLLSGSLKNDADELADIGGPLADEWTEEMVDAIKTARSKEAQPEDVVNKMEEVSGAGAAGGYGAALGGGGTFGGAGASGTWQKKKKQNKKRTKGLTK